MSRPTPREDQRLNEAMGHAAVAGERRPADFVVKRPSLLTNNGRELLRQTEFDLIETAREKAKKSGLVAYRRSFRDGSYAVPSQSDLGLVHDVDLNWHNGQPISCTCPSFLRYCIHVGAAVNAWWVQKDMSDAAYAEMTQETLKEMRREHSD